MMIRIGCCGFPVARAKYFQRFSAVEVQKTFYQPPRVPTADRWRREAPSGFVYTMKAWQLITHESSSPTYRRLKTVIPGSKARHYGSFQPTEEVLQAWRATERIAEALRPRVIVFQSPARFGPSDRNKANLRSFFGGIDRGSYVFAWEPRGDWDPQTIRGLCSDLDLLWACDPLQSGAEPADRFYYRLHGQGGYRYSYSAEELGGLARLALEGCRESNASGSGGGPRPDGGEDAGGERHRYVFFNNTDMLENAAELADRTGVDGGAVEAGDV